ncbi:SRPBCC family protein [Phycicoccus flavus]|uniref:SRPBCC family protein n=1 Tax=Phycicoccus flavus TaxID=2502783 RepID=UPI000FEB7D7A|nr:SRPBCC family protein [Phycicoccus flavus]NHA69503.1 SRPBCC family protein [Phycicoccus flavus]
MGKPFTVSRETIVLAPPEAVRGLLDDFHAWRAWSPWEDLDPDMERTYSGPDSGVGARYAWDGNKRAGRGTMELTGVQPHRVDVAVAFEKPFPSRSRVEFVLTPQEGETHVEWFMRGELGLVQQAFALVKPMDELMGPDLERGLANLKAQAETEAGSVA